MTADSNQAYKHAPVYYASYFGSDFNYATQQDFRMKFRSMTHDKPLVEIGLIADMVDNGAENNNAQGGGAAGNQQQNHMIDANEDMAFREFMQLMQNQVAMGIDVTHALRYVLQNRSKALDFYGKVMAFFFLSFVMTYIVAVKNILNAHDVKHKIELDLFVYIMPFVSFIIDASVKRAY